MNGNHMAEQDMFKQLLAALSKFASIPEIEQRNLAERLHVATVAKHQHFVTAGDVPDKVAFIAKGLFRVYYLTEEGKESCLVFRDSGRFLSAYSSFLENTASQYSFQALEDSVLLYITVADYKQMMHGDDCWRQVVSQYFQMLFIEKEQRELTFLSADAETRYRIFLKTYPDLSKRISQYHIASYLGITPEALSRIRNRLT